MDAAANHDLKIDRDIVVRRLAERLKDAQRAVREYKQLEEGCIAARQMGKARGHAKRAVYWSNVASGIRWMISLESPK